MNVSAGAGESRWEGGGGERRKSVPTRLWEEKYLSSTYGNEAIPHAKMSTMMMVMVIWLFEKSSSRIYSSYLNTAQILGVVTSYQRIKLISLGSSTDQILRMH